MQLKSKTMKKPDNNFSVIINRNDTRPVEFKGSKMERKMKRNISNYIKGRIKSK